jgi:two-component system OmpR family sensor kinase
MLPIRVRLALFTGLLVAAVVIVVGAFVYLRLEADLRAAVDDGLAERAQELIADPPDGGTIDEAASDIGDTFAVVVTSSGSVVAASAGLDVFAILGAIPVAGLTGVTSAEFLVPTDEGPQAVRVLATPAAGGEVVLTGVAFDDQRDALTALSSELALAIPIGVLLGIATGWLVAGAALRPVDRMRREAEAISASDLDRRLSVAPARDELSALGRSLNRMLDRLATAMARERRVVDDASHELRTPLANMKAELDLALSKPRSDDELRAALTSAADETDRLSRLAADLLVLARANDGRLPLSLVDADISALIASAVAGFESRAGAVGVGLESTVKPGLRARVDESRLRQALDNLIDNAVRFAGKDATVKVTAHAESGDQLVLSVADSGPGFPPEFLAQAFEPFSRADAGRTRKEGGAGLGLAIVQAVAEAHGGTVVARNQPGGGAIVEVSIPLSRPE